MRFLTTSVFLATTVMLTPSAFAAQTSSKPASSPQITQTSSPASSAQVSTHQIGPEVGLKQNRKMAVQQNDGMITPGSFDRGIYAPVYADGQSTCAAIMSYNFTPGENPQLKDVTTCTPARPNSVYRTEGENKKGSQPPAATLQTISSPVVSPEPQANSETQAAKAPQTPGFSKPMTSVDRPSGPK